MADKLFVMYPFLWQLFSVMYCMFSCSGSYMIELETDLTDNIFLSKIPSIACTSSSSIAIIKTKVWATSKSSIIAIPVSYSNVLPLIISSAVTTKTTFAIKIQIPITISILILVSLSITSFLLL